MKKVIVLAAFALVSLGSYAQAPLEEGGLQLNAGFGTSGWGIPIYVGVDYGLMKDITLGGQLSYQSKTSGFLTSTAIGIGVNGNYHFNTLLEIPSEFDVYAGLGISYYAWSYKFKNGLSGKGDNDNLGLGIQIGGRYFFTDKFGVALELSPKIAGSGAQIGITYKL